MYTKTKNDDLPAYLFHQGTNYNAYTYMGTHKKDNNTVFRVWAPNADSVSVVGDFNSWDGTRSPMNRITREGIWETELTNISLGDNAKYKFLIKNGEKSFLKSDPYAFYSETLDKNASILYDIDDYSWQDEGWMLFRRENIAPDSVFKCSCPINIYEVHLGSWMTKDGKSTKDGSAYLNYREIAEKLGAYVKRMGYTHVELLPIMEHPYDGSWGYQICGYYAPTSRFGTPDDFMFFVDHLHNMGIGVILDWVPAHFPKDEHGLYEFDGSRLYEYQGEDRMEHRGWGTRCFDVGRNEVQCFLISNALFWIEKYHIDGIRIDAVASMLYLDYDREEGKWNPNSKGGKESLDAIAFFQKLNSEVQSRHPDILMIAEESTAWPGVTKPASDEGLGFNIKWNMGWANDMFEYISTDPYFRSYVHNKITFSLVYAFSENFLLPISHDEVVHGKRSLLDKMHGEYNDKFSMYRAFICHMMAHPGKKLLFMGSEYGQFREWDYQNQLEWFMTDFEMHDKLQYFISQINDVYLKYSQLWDNDFSWEGFSWIEADDSENNVIAYQRMSKNNDPIIAVMNFSGSDHKDYKIKVSEDGNYKIILYSDSSDYGGNTAEYPKSIRASKGILKLDLPKLSGIYLIRSRRKKLNKEYTIEIE